MIWTVICAEYSNPYLIITACFVNVITVQGHMDIYRVYVVYGVQEIPSRSKGVSHTLSLELGRCFIQGPQCTLHSIAYCIINSQIHFQTLKVCFSIVHIFKQVSWHAFCLHCA